MAKTGKTPTTVTKTPLSSGDYGVAKGATRYDPEEWERFEKISEDQFRVKPTDMLRRFVREVTTDRYINLHGLRPESHLELKKYADELGVTLQVAVDRVLTDFLAERRRERTKK